MEMRGPEKTGPLFPISLPFLVCSCTKRPLHCDLCVSLHELSLETPLPPHPCSATPGEHTPKHLHSEAGLCHPPNKRSPSLSSAALSPVALSQPHRGCESLLLPLTDTRSLFLGSLAENQISNKGAKALARSLMVNRSLMVLE